MLQLTPEGSLIASLNAIVAVVLIILTILSIRVLLKQFDTAHFAATMFALIYSIFLIVQEFHLISLLNNGIPLNGYVYSTLAISLQCILPSVILYVWAYYTFKSKNIRLIFTVIVLGYMIVIWSVVGVFQPFVPELDPVTQLWDMNLQPPLTYIQYTMLTASLIVSFLLLIQSFRVDDHVLAMRYRYFAIGYLLYTLGIMFRFMGMDLIFTLTRKVLLCMGVYLMIASFIGLKLQDTPTIIEAT
ncbi:MAG: membrane protein of unknown function [Candidatus Thorarchaeota archaeon]|nr:MAG: membrane protein of unknown function [Candidatus Thorarchaeota archaeon]